MQDKNQKECLRINVTIIGKFASEARELKQEGVARNNADLVRQGISVLYQREVDQKLKTLRLRTLEQTEET